MRTRWLSAIALIVVLTIPASQIAIGVVVHGVIECCCGPHDADHACGCPDCPAGDGQRAVGDDSGTPAFKPCGADGTMVKHAVSPDMALATAVTLPVAPPVSRVRATSDPLPERPSREPATPPPRLG